MKINCLIVDDEPLALDILEKYIGNTPQLVLIGRSTDAFQAIQLLRELEVDVIFLDINMPEFSGISMVRSMKDPPLIVFTTAYSEHAIQGFELDAVDYLVKPFSFERFVKAVNKVEEKLSFSKNQHNDALEYTTFISLKSDKKIFKVEYPDIHHVQAYGDFSKVYTKNGVIISSENLKKLENILPEHLFLRIHKSYLVSLMHVQYIEGNMVKMEHATVPIGASYREKLLSRISMK